MPANAEAFDIEATAVAETREQIGAVLIRSPRYGEVWVAFTASMVPELMAEEAGRGNPRPVLLVADVARLHGKSEAAVWGVLELARVFPGFRVLS